MITTIFLDFICSLTYDICFSLSDLLHSLQQALGSSTLLQLTQINSFLWLRISHCIYVPQRFYPFICWCTSRLLSRPGYCKHLCNEHWGTGVFSNLGSSAYMAEKAMAPHSNTLAWKIPWMEEPGGLESMGSLRVRHDWATSLSLFTFMHWRRKWQPTPVFLPWESQGQGSLLGCCLWGRTESDTTEVT